MSYWNNRIIETEKGFFEVREVYYNHDGTVFDMKEVPFVLRGISLDDLKLGLTYVQTAMDKPVLKESEIVFVDYGINEDEDTD